MSGSVRRRHSKWDHKSSEHSPETLRDRVPLRRHKEPSPSRDLQRHDNRSKERAITWDREQNSSGMSPGLDEWSHQHRNRSPRNGWGRSYRSRSRSRSPAHHVRREPPLNDRSRSRSGVSAQICRDFAVGRCRRGQHCQFLHQDDQSYDRRRSLECSAPDDWEGRHQRVGASRYSPLDNKDYDSRTEKSMHLCEEFLKGKCRRGTSCRYLHHDTVADRKEPIDNVQRDMVRERERDRGRDNDNDNRNRDTSYRIHDREPADVFEKVHVEDVYRARDNGHRSRDTYRNRDREPHKSAGAICKFFASGNCRNGDHCRYIHGVQERISPERRSQDDRRGADRILEGGQVWDGPRWSDAGPVSNAPPVQGWEEERNEATVVVEQEAAAKSRDDLWSHDKVTVKGSWSTPPTNEEILTQNDRSFFQWKTENNVLAMGLSAPRAAEITSGDMETSPLDIKQHGLSSSTIEKPYSGNTSFGPVRQDAVGDTLFEKPYSDVPLGQKLYNDAFTEQNSNSNHKGDKPAWYNGDGRNFTVNNDTSCILQSPTMNAATHHRFSQNQRSINEHISSISPARQGQPHLSFQPSEGGRMQESRAASFFLNTADVDGSRLLNATSSGHASATASSPAGHGQPQFSQQPAEGGRMQESHSPAVFFNTTADDRPHLMNANSFGHASAIATSPAGQGRTQFSLHPFGEGIMQESHRSSNFINTRTADGPNFMNTTSSGHASAVAAGLGNVSSEQLVQLSHLSASLAQLLESRQQLPQLSSDTVPPGMSKLPDSVTSVPPLSSSTNIAQPNQAPDMPKQLYDPLSDSIEPNMHNSGVHTLPSGVERKGPRAEPNNEGDELNQEPVAMSKGDENVEKVVEGGSKLPENKPSVDMPGEDGADDGKKSKDSKAIRPFKFALAEFVKELLKPSWKDGQVNKDSYKAIVKKVIDKIIETQGLQIPQTKEKIDQYLSNSKPKIEKLVQAYVGRYQKK